MVKQEVKIGRFQGYAKDFDKADKLAPNGPIDRERSTWHHHQDGTTMQEMRNKHTERKNRGNSRMGVPRFLFLRIEMVNYGVTRKNRKTISKKRCPDNVN